MSRLEELIQELCPNGVEYPKLNTVCSIYDGTHSTPEYKESGIKFVSVENIGNLYASTKYISEEAFEQYKIKPQIGDVLMTRIGSIGVCAVIDKNELELSRNVQSENTQKINDMERAAFYGVERSGTEKNAARRLVRLPAVPWPTAGISPAAGRPDLMCRPGSGYSR